MKNIHKDAVVRPLNEKEDSYDIDVVGDELINRSVYDDLLQYRYSISFVTEHEFSNELKDAVEKIMVRSGAITAMQMYDDIVNGLGNVTMFKSIIIDVSLEYKKAGTKSRSFVSYEKGELSLIEYTNGFIGPNNDYGLWRLHKEGYWEYVKQFWKVSWNGEKISYTFEADPKRLGEPVTSIYRNVEGCMAEAKNAFKKHFKQLS